VTASPPPTSSRQFSAMQRMVGMQILDSSTLTLDLNCCKCFAYFSAMSITTTATVSKKVGDCEFTYFKHICFDTSYQFFLQYWQILRVWPLSIAIWRNCTKLGDGCREGYSGLIGR
jgi:hypothetical protein